jgi:hypothetical protein
MLLSRQARYSGLIDSLDFCEGEIGEAFADASQWVALNIDEETIFAQISAAKASGIQRALLHIGATEKPSIGEPHSWHNPRYRHPWLLTASFAVQIRRP